MFLRVRLERVYNSSYSNPGKFEWLFDQKVPEKLYRIAVQIKCSILLSLMDDSLREVKQKSLELEHDLRERVLSLSDEFINLLK